LSGNHPQGCRHARARSRDPVEDALLGFEETSHAGGGRRVRDVLVDREYQGSYQKVAELLKLLVRFGRKVCPQSDLPHLHSSDRPGAASACWCFVIETSLMWMDKSQFLVFLDRPGLELVAHHHCFHDLTPWIAAVFP